MTDQGFCFNGGKKRFVSEAKAKASARTMMNKRGSRKLRVYRCPHCFDYHITSHLK